MVVSSVSVRGKSREALKDPSEKKEGVWERSSERKREGKASCMEWRTSPLKHSELLVMDLDLNQKSIVDEAQWIPGVIPTTYHDLLGLLHNSMLPIRS